MGDSYIVNILQTIIVLVGILALANVSLKFLNKKMKADKGIIEVIDRLQVTNTSALSIVKLGDKHYLMNFSESGNTILKEIDDDKLIDIIKERKETNNINEKFKTGKNLIEKRFKGE